MPSRRSLFALDALYLVLSDVRGGLKPSVVFTAQALIGAGGAVFGPALAAVSLGLVGHAGLARRMGRNQALDHTGNFANAAMLPLVGQKLAAGSTHAASPMSAAIIAAQLVMIPVALAASRLAASWGRKPTLLLGFAVLPVRGALYTLSDNPYYEALLKQLELTALKQGSDPVKIAPAPKELAGLKAKRALVNKWIEQLRYDAGKTGPR